MKTRTKQVWTPPKVFKTVPLTNTEFLKGVFGENWQNAHICAFKEDPGMLDKLGLKHLWAGNKAHDNMTLRMTSAPGHNSYYVVSTFKDLVSGRAVRRKQYFEATYCLTLDDIGGGQSAKIGWDRVVLEPSFIIETSPQNFQPGYIMDAPVHEAWIMDHLTDELVRTGLAAKGDPGMKGRTRYVRLSGGHNTKSKYGPGGFKCRCVHWNPSLTYSVDQIADAYGIDMTTATQSGSGTIDSVDFDADPWADVLMELGAVKGEHMGSGGEPVLDITCPFVYEHTGGEDTGSAYMGGGRFYCHHSCKTRENEEFQAKVKKDLGAKFDAFWRGAANAAAKAEFPIVTGPTTQELKTGAFMDKMRRAKTLTEIYNDGPVLDGNFSLKGIVPAQGIAVLYGPSGVGKSAVLMDMLLGSVLEPEWRGHKWKMTGVVLYAASEGGEDDARNRAIAWLKDRGHGPTDKFIMYPGSFDIDGGETGKQTVIDLVKWLKDQAQPVRHVVLDTLAMNLHGDENSSTDMSALLRLLQGVHRAVGCVVWLVHHSGKDTSKGARGSSALRAAVDVEIRLDKEPGAPGTIILEKLRKGRDGLVFGYDLKEVVLGTDSDGDMVGAVVAVDAIAPKKTIKPGTILEVIKAAFDVLSPFENTRVKLDELHGEILKRQTDETEPCVKPGADYKKHTLKRDIIRAYQTGFLDWYADTEEITFK